MKVLQFGNTDRQGNRFNGSELAVQLNRRGIPTQHCVYRKQGDDPWTWQLNNLPLKVLNYLSPKIERRLSIQSLLYFTPFALPFYKSFRDAEIIHLHLIHTGFFSLTSLPVISRQKATVWTLHDPWALTGHCIYPFDCIKWQSGCGNCPYLDIDLPVKEDHTAFMWRIKKFLYYASDIDIILASRFMYDMAKKSPLLASFRLHHIPFGLDLKMFKPTDTIKAKLKMGIPVENLVLAFRSTNSLYKGLPYIKECLKKIKITCSITLLTFNTKGLLEDLKEKYHIIELGWIDNENDTIVAYNASDIFIMPSIQEAFGMMAIEAMACGKPVIVFDDTSLPEVIFANEGGGVVVPQKNVEALTSALEKLIGNQEERRNIGIKTLELAKKHYDIDIYINRIISLYGDALKRKESKRRR